MSLNEEKKIMHVAWIIVLGFWGSVVFFLASFFYIPDFTSATPIIPQIVQVLGRIQTAFYILGCTALGVKLAEEKKTIPAIGFTMMSIAQGVIFVIYLISINGSEDIAEGYKLFRSSLFLLVPSMILIAFYSDFPRWLNITGILACIPYIIENILFAVTNTFTKTAMNIDGIGLLLFNIVAFSWGLYILKNAKKEIAHLNSENK